MAIRVLVCLALVITLSVSLISLGSAGPPPSYPPQIAYCPPPPPCGPRPLPSPFLMCGRVLNTCANVAGAVIGIPSAVMAGLLAAPSCPPPLPPCGPPPCGPRLCAVPTGPACMPAPRPMPAPITKCKPAPQQFYCPPGAYCPPGGYRAYPGMGLPRLPLPPRPFASMAPAVPMMALKMAEMPLKLVTGVLTAPLLPGKRTLANAQGKNSDESTFGCYW